MNDRIEQTNRTLKTWASIEIADKRERQLRSYPCNVYTQCVQREKQQQALFYIRIYESFFVSRCMCVWLSLVNINKRHQPPATIARDWMFGKEYTEKEMGWLKVRGWEIVVVKWKCFSNVDNTRNFSFEMLFIWPEKTEWQLQKQQHQQQYRALAINDSEEKSDAKMGQINEKTSKRWRWWFYFK